MKRREFIRLLGGAASAWPLAARAQSQAMPTIGFLNGATAEGYAPYLKAFLEGLKQLGFVDGRTVRIEYRWAGGRYERLPELAAELVRRGVAVISATSTPAAVAAKAATSTVPVVFTTSGDPVTLGLVTNLRRPDGNVTGVTQLNVEVAPKRLELMHELLPKASAFALLVNPAGPNSAPVAKGMRSAAGSLGLHLHVLEAKTEAEIEASFAKLHDLQAGGVVIGTDPYFNTRSQQLAGLALRHRMPAIYQYEEFTAAGGLMSYGGSITDSYRGAGIYTARILKGDKVSDLPVQQSTRVELIINLKTARALGVEFPSSLLDRADVVLD